MHVVSLKLMHVVSDHHNVGAEAARCSNMKAKEQVDGVSRIVAPKPRCKLLKDCAGEGETRCTHKAKKELEVT